MDKKLEQCMTSLFNALSAKSEEEAMDLFGQAITHASESKKKINNPEHFNIYINNKLNKGVKLLADTLHEPSVCKDKNKPNFIYQNYSFLESHIRNLCELREGSSCSADKSRYILKMYLNYSITGEIPEFNPEVEHYWMPNFGDNEMWMNYCDSLYQLYYGKTEEYFKSYKSLMECEIRKFKHTLHRWFIEFKDGDVVEFYQSWDKNNTHPLNEYLNRGEYYLLHKMKVKDKDFEPYEPMNEEEEFLFDNYVKIPKSEVQEIYKKSEEVMV